MKKLTTTQLNYLKYEFYDLLGKLHGSQIYDGHESKLWENLLRLPVNKTYKVDRIMATPDGEYLWKLVDVDTNKEITKTSKEMNDNWRKF